MHFHCFKTFGTIYGGGARMSLCPSDLNLSKCLRSALWAGNERRAKKKTQAHKKQWKTWERSGTVTANNTIHCGLFSDPNMNQTEKESGLRRKMPWVSRKTAKQMRKAWQIRGNENGFTISVTSLWCSLMPLCSSCLSKKPLTAFSNIQNTSQRSMYQVKSGSQVHASLKCAADVRRFDSLLLSSRFETFYTLLSSLSDLRKFTCFLKQERIDAESIVSWYFYYSMMTSAYYGIIVLMVNFSIWT